MRHRRGRGATSPPMIWPCPVMVSEERAVGGERRVEPSPEGPWDEAHTCHSEERSDEESPEGPWDAPRARLWCSRGILRLAPEDLRSLRMTGNLDVPLSPRGPVSSHAAPTGAGRNVAPSDMALSCHGERGARRPRRATSRTIPRRPVGRGAHVSFRGAKRRGVPRRPVGRLPSTTLVLSGDSSTRSGGPPLAQNDRWSGEAAAFPWLQVSTRDTAPRGLRILTRTARRHVIDSEATLRPSAGRLTLVAAAAAGRRRCRGRRRWRGRRRCWSPPLPPGAVAASRC